MYSLELTEGVCILESNVHRSDLVRDCHQGNARFYAITNPRPRYRDYSYAWCHDDGQCILLKPFPADYLRPRWALTDHYRTIPYDSIHKTMDPVEADAFWKENRTSDQREQRILNGLACLHEAMRALERTDSVLSELAPSPAQPPSSLLASSSLLAPQAKEKEKVHQKPQSRISTLVIADALASNATCPITMTPLTPTNAVCVAPCYHVFSKEGITPWLSKNVVCPMCREPCSL